MRRRTLERAAHGSFGASGILEGVLGDSVRNIGGGSPTEIIGSGTVIAQNGLFQIGTLVQVGAGDTTIFTILPNATLAFADAVNGGTIAFKAASGSGALDMGSLATFHAPVKNLFVGGTVNVATSYIDFQNAGTAATATLTNITTAGATMTVAGQAIQILGN
jgi:hypothetical protein